MNPPPLQPARAPQEVDGARLPHVATVVLNWHGRADTLGCLRALAALSYSPLSVVLIDNGCREFSAEEVSALLPNARYVRTDTNLGFAGGANLGMRQALGDGAEHVWFLNNDAEPEPGALSEILAVAQQDAATGIVGPKILLGQD